MEKRLNRNESLEQRKQLLEMGYFPGEIARKLGITRQAISNYIKKHHLPKKDVFAIADAVKLWGYSRATIYNLIQQKKVPAEKRSNKWYILTRENPRRNCVICGEPLEKWHRRYCKNERCRKIAHYQTAWRRFKEKQKQKKE